MPPYLCLARPPLHDTRAPSIACLATSATPMPRPPMPHPAITDVCQRTR